MNRSTVSMNWALKAVGVLAIAIGMIFVSQSAVLAKNIPHSDGRGGAPARTNGIEPGSHPQLFAESTLTEAPPKPLPHDCGGFTPGEDGEMCCMMGYVYVVSSTLPTVSVAESATVTLAITRNVVATGTTQPGYHNKENVPYFAFDLVEAGVEPGAWVTVTAYYRGRQNQTRYQVMPDGQQVDVVLPISQTFEEQVVIVDDQDSVASPDLPGFHISGPVERLTESACGAGSEFWEGAIYSGTTTADGVGPATITATYRPTLPVAGAYELFAYAPHGCVGTTARYDIHIPGESAHEATVPQATASENGGQWISLGKYFFPAGTESYVQIQNVNGWLEPEILGLDALKWEFRSPFQPITTVIVDNLPEASTPSNEGFYPNPVAWYERTKADGCDNKSKCIGEPIFWGDHIYWTYSKVSDPRTNWAQWRTSLPMAGTYEVDIYMSHCFAGARTAQYRLSVDGSVLDEVTVDQAPQGGTWVNMGRYALPAHTPVSVYLDDVTGEDHVIMSFDAIRWVLRLTRDDFAPVATIHSVQPSAAAKGQASITLRGSGQDTDATDANITAYEWRSVANDALLSISPTLVLSTTDLAVGVHEVAFRVQDDEGVWSSPVTTTFEILPAYTEKSWHFMLYLAGDNNLSDDFQAVLERLEQSYMLDMVTVTVQLDREGAGGVRRYLVQPDGQYTDGINRWHLGELNSGDPQTLADYLQWGLENYPADNVYLAVADHGRGIQGIAWDDNSNTHITLPGLRAALDQGTEGGKYTIDVLHLDACLMSMVEVAHEVWPYADYMVASENLGWAFFTYEKYIQALAPGSTETPRQVATRVAQIYAAQIRYAPYTIAALDISRINSLSTAVDGLASALMAAPEEISTVQTALGQVQRLDSQEYGQLTTEDEFIDLRHFAELLAAISSNAEVQQAAQAVVTATALSQAGEITTTLVYESHGSGTISGQWVDLEDANGMAIYFPTGPSSHEYPAYVDDPAFQFGQATRWDDFLRQYIGPPSGIIETPTPPDPLEAYQVFLPLVLQRE